MWKGLSPYERTRRTFSCDNTRGIHVPHLRRSLLYSNPLLGLEVYSSLFTTYKVDGETLSIRLLDPFDKDQRTEQLYS